MPENLTEEQRNRLWEHGLHEDTIFFNHLNFFLIFESVLLGVVGVLYSRPQPSTLMLRIIIILGLSLTLVWGYAQSRQKHMLNILQARCYEFIPDYKVTIEKRHYGKWGLSV